MKKLLIVLSLLFGVLFWTSNVNAATLEDLKKILTDPIVLGGQESEIKNDVKVRVDKYLKENTLSSADINYIYNAVTNARNILKNQSSTTFEGLSADIKEQLKDIVDDIDDNTDVDATVEDGKLVIYNDDNTVFDKVSDPIKQTGESTNILYVIYAISLSVVLIGVGLTVKKLNTNR